ncbi:MAG: energy transducer TonB [Crocinitomicaceae bacterium]|nr:energy transducer TonB [Crocinitomicaceae bacterium]
MKKSLQSISLLLVGLLLVSSCSEEKTGNSLKQITENIDLNKDQVLEDTTSLDTTSFEEPEIIEPVPPPPPPPPAPEPPRPWPPEPGPEPWPPKPEPWPIEPPELLPEPPPPPMSLNPIIDFPDVEPRYPGGEGELMEFISKNIKYPQIDLENGDQGRVILEFIVEKDGEVNEVKILRGVSATMDKEAKRVIELMPNWKPGEAGGKIVRTKMRLPVTFRLD